VEVLDTKPPGVEDPEDLLLLTVVPARAPVGNLVIGFVAGKFPSYAFLQFPQLRVLV